MANWAGGQLISTTVGITNVVNGSRRCPAGNGFGQQPAPGVVQMLFENPALRTVDDRDLRQRAAGRVEDGVDPQPVVRQEHWPLMGQPRIEFRHAQRLDQPRRLEWHHLPRLADGKLVVTAVVHGRRLVPPHPEPKEFVIAAEVEFRAGQPGFRPQAESTGPLEGHARPQRGKARPAERCPVGGKRLDLRVVPVHHFDDLLQASAKAATPAAADWCTAARTVDNWRRSGRTAPSRSATASGVGRRSFVVSCRRSVGSG